MSKFEKDYQAAKDGAGIEVLARRKKELEFLKKQLRSCRNGFRAQVLNQEIEKRKIEYQVIDNLF